MHRSIIITCTSSLLIYLHRVFLQRGNQFTPQAFSPAMPYSYMSTSPRFTLQLRNRALECYKVNKLSSLIAYRTIYFPSRPISDLFLSHILKTLCIYHSDKKPTPIFEFYSKINIEAEAVNSSYACRFYTKAWRIFGRRREFLQVAGHFSFSYPSKFSFMRIKKGQRCAMPIVPMLCNTKIIYS